jgi:hypothetical protein
MTRKTPSPMIESELMIECDHMKLRRSQENLNNEENNSINYSVNGSTTSSNNYYQFNNNNNNNNHNNNNIIGSPIKRLTSFEELAKKSESNSLLYIHESITDNNYRHYSNAKPKSDYNICYTYKNLDNNEELDYSSIKHQLMIKKSTSHSNNIRRNERKHSSSDNSPFDYDLLRERRKENRFMYDDEDGGRLIENNDNSIKSYDRFFNSDDDEEYEGRHAKKKSSASVSHKYRAHVSGTEADDDDENSSNSPPHKSISNTPMNECTPLLSCDTETTVIYQSPLPPAVISPSSLRHKSKIPLRVGHNSFKKTSSISSPDSDKSDGYQTAINRYDNRIAQSMAYQSSSGSNQNQRNDNKIRIKINQNN